MKTYKINNRLYQVDDNGLCTIQLPTRVITLKEFELKFLGAIEQPDEEEKPGKINALHWNDNGETWTDEYPLVEKKIKKCDNDVEILMGQNQPHCKHAAWICTNCDNKLQKKFKHNPTTKLEPIEMPSDSAFATDDEYEWACRVTDAINHLNQKGQQP